MNRRARAMIPIHLWAVFFLSTLPAFGQQTITVGKNIHVSKAHPDRSHYETQLAADPKDPKRLLGGSIIATLDEQQHKTIVYASFDGGKSWEPTLEVGADLTSRDPAVFYGPDGTVYFICFGFDQTLKVETLLYRSKDGGRTWLPPTILPAGDRPYLTVDNTGGKNHGHVYINGTKGIRTFDATRRISSFYVSRSLDGGSTFNAPAAHASTGGNYVVTSSNGVVLSDGTFVVLLAEVKDYYKEDGTAIIPENKSNSSNAWLKVVTSGDGGDSYSKAVIINDFYMDFFTSPGSAVNSIPVLAVDSSGGPFRDRLYAVWPDVRSGRSEILLSYSSDKGKTWTRPMAVNDDQPRPASGQGPDDFMPVVAVNPAGVVGVMWYDRRENPDNLGWWVRFAASLDGGETFRQSVRVSEAPHDLNGNKPMRLFTETRGGGNPHVGSRGGSLKTEVHLDRFTFMGGDTAGMAVDAVGTFHPFWTDNRTGIAQIWTAPVTVQGKAILYGSTELEKLDDITNKVNLTFNNARYDRATKTVSVEASLVNTSKETLIAPINVRVLSLSSKLGALEILNANAQGNKSGAVWDFSALLNGNKLKLGEKSKAKRLEFRVSDPRPIRPVEVGRYALRFVSLETQVLGKVMRN